MTRLIERAFDPARPVQARRFFVAAGRHFNPGDTFDWKRMAVAQRRVRQLFDAGKLMHGEAVVTPAPTIEQEIEDMDILTTAAAPVDPLPPEGEHDEADTPAPPPVDDLDGLNMKELRVIAEAEDAPTRVSREAQREAIREHRRARAGE
jgi:hypothetical protein